MLRKFSILLVIPILLMLYNNTAYSHQHIMNNGLTVTHAHPFDVCDHGPCTCHYHSEKEYLFYALISDSLSVMFFVVVAIIISISLIYLKSLYASPFTKLSGRLLLPSLRAPPVMVFHYNA